MNKEKYIEEMAKDICGLGRDCHGCTASMSYICKAKKYAERAVDKGYRKASEVAREMFEEIERFLYMHFRICKEEIGNDDTEYVKGRLELNTQMQNLIAELKKKYTESEKDK